MVDSVPTTGADSAEERLPYEPPVLTDYGTAESITAAGGGAAVDATMGSRT